MTTETFIRANPTRLPSGYWGVKGTGRIPALNEPVRVQTRGGKTWYAQITSKPQVTAWGWRASSESMSKADAQSYVRKLRNRPVIPMTWPEDPTPEPAPERKPDANGFYPAPPANGRPKWEPMTPAVHGEPVWSGEWSTLTLNRSGKFDLSVFGDTHCGLADRDGNVPCTYALTLVCEASGLDKDGFLVEQVGIDRFFNEDLGPVGVSCELLALNCARELYRKIRRENPHVKIKGLRLTIAPTPEGMQGAADMTFAWGEGL